MIPIGREAEMARIRSFLDGLSRDPRMLLLEGDAGIGKTVLLEYGRNAATQRGHHVLSARPAETEMPLAYVGLADLLEAVPQALIEDLPLPQRHAVRYAVLQEEPSQDPVDPRTTSMAVRALLRSLAGTSPVVIAVDDLQWLDPPSARILSFVLRRTQHEPLGFLATARTSWPGHQLPPIVDGAPPDKLDRVLVGPLSLGAIREILGVHLAMSPGRSLLVRLHELSGGNPLFALELGGRVHSGVPPELFGLQDAPESLRRLMLARMAALPPRARDVLLVCALATDTSLPVICAAARRPAAAQADLEEGIRSGLSTIADGKIAFVHPVMRSVVIGEARPADRRAAHRRLASVICDPEAHARHLALGTQAPDEAVAQAVEEAAQIAARRGACEVASGLAELAVAVTPLARAEARQRRIVLAAEQRFESSDPGRACSLLEGILDAVPAGPGRAEILRRLARYRVFRGEPLAVAAATLHQALAHTGHDSALRTVILLDQAVAASNSADSAEAMRCRLLAMESAEKTGDEALLAQCCAGLAFQAFATGRGVRPELIARALAGPMQPRWLSMEKRPNVAVGHVLHWAGDLDGARACYEQEYARAVAEGTETGLPLVLWAMAETEAWAGNWPQAGQLAAEGYSLAEDSGSPVGIALMSGPRGLLHAYQGRIEPAQRDAAHAVELAQALGMPLVAIVGVQPFGIAALSIRDALTAHRQLGPFAATVLAAGMAEPSLYRFVPDEVEALIRLGQLGMAEALLGPFEARSAQLGRGWGIATAGRCRGLLLANSGDLGGAAASLESALTEIRRLALPFEEARTLLVAGEVHRRARHKHIAASFLGDALHIFERLGAPLWAARARSELDRVGIRGPRPESGQGLTITERHVADLAVAGRTNNEIAAELFMGLRTVEAHLSRVYRKVGVRSRTGLSRALASPEQPIR
jgi:DNA-binding CsgD family transcriptional regulator